MHKRRVNPPPALTTTHTQAESDSEGLSVQYEVEDVIDHRIVPQDPVGRTPEANEGSAAVEGEGGAAGRSVIFLVKWVGYDEPTWEPAENLKNAPEIVQGYTTYYQQSMKSKRNSAAARNKARKNMAAPSTEKKRGRPAKPFNFSSIYPDPDIKVSEDEDFGFIDKDAYLRSVKDDQKLWEAALSAPHRGEKPRNGPPRPSESPGQSHMPSAQGEVKYSHHDPDSLSDLDDGYKIESSRRESSINPGRSNAGEKREEKEEPNELILEGGSSDNSDDFMDLLIEAQEQCLGDELGEEENPPHQPEPFDFDSPPNPQPSPPFLEKPDPIEPLLCEVERPQLMSQRELSPTQAPKRTTSSHLEVQLGKKVKPNESILSNFQKEKPPVQAINLESSEEDPAQHQRVSKPCVPEQERAKEEREPTLHQQIQHQLTSILGQARKITQNQQLARNCPVDTNYKCESCSRHETHNSLLAELFGDLVRSRVHLDNLFMEQETLSVLSTLNPSCPDTTPPFMRFNKMVDISDNRPMSAMIQRRLVPRNEVREVLRDYRIEKLVRVDGEWVAICQVRQTESSREHFKYVPCHSMGEDQSAVVGFLTRQP